MDRKQLRSFILDVVKQQPKNSVELAAAVVKHPEYWAFSQMTLADVFSTLQVDDFIEISEAMG